LDGVGTLFIKNIHFLGLEAQENLALYIRYGYYTIFKSDQKMVSDVRIICSSNQNLSLLVQEGKFSKSLFQELKHTMISMPSLLTLPDDELGLLAEGFTQQSLVSDDLQHILLLTEKEKSSLVTNRPVSLQDLKDRVQQMIIKKSKKNMINHDIEWDPTYNTTDPDLVAAAKLGKQALKDPKMMILLWNKFKNQNKISTFLGVNRSSVNRRCKEYNLVD
jgi:DNA-binding NtrC family response regulator